MWVKICGWRTEAMLEAALAAGARPDAIGLNFYAGSPRATTIEIARSIAGKYAGEFEPVGLFVEHSVAEVVDIARQVGLRTVQLHGEYPAEALAPLREVRVIRVYRLAENSLDAVEQDLKACREAGIVPWACLVEPKVDGAYGGTGAVGPWELLREWPRDFPPLLLAGGLTPRNVAEAIRVVRPWGVDTASGVEIERGRKDPLLVAEFVRVARSADV